MIIICEICKQYSCPASCPEFDGYVTGLGESIGACELCGCRAYEDEECYAVNGKIICQDCAEELVSQELLELFDLADVKEFFDMLR